MAFRTSHEVAKIRAVDDSVLRAWCVTRCRRAPPARHEPDRPVLRGTAQNPDVYFSRRETVNPFYESSRM